MADFYLKSGAGAVELTAKAWSAGDKMVPTWPTPRIKRFWL